MATTASGWPYVEPSAHPLEYPAASQAAANMFESRFKDGPGSILKVRVFTGVSTDANGFASFNATQMGLTTITGATASVNWSAVYDGQTPHFASARVSSNLVQVLVLGLSAASAATVNRMANKTGLVLYVTAWGT